MDQIHILQTQLIAEGGNPVGAQSREMPVMNPGWDAQTSYEPDPYDVYDTTRIKVDYDLGIQTFAMRADSVAKRAAELYGTSADCQPAASKVVNSQSKQVEQQYLTTPAPRRPTTKVHLAPPGYLGVQSYALEADSVARKAAARNCGAQETGKAPNKKRPPAETNEKVKLPAQDVVPSGESKLTVMRAGEPRTDPVPVPPPIETMPKSTAEQPIATDDDDYLDMGGGGTGGNGNQEDYLHPVTEGPQLAGSRHEYTGYVSTQNDQAPSMNSATPPEDKQQPYYMNYEPDEEEEDPYDNVNVVPQFQQGEVYEPLQKWRHEINCYNDITL